MEAQAGLTSSTGSTLRKKPFASARSTSPWSGQLAVEALVGAIQDLGVSDTEVIFICRGGGAETELTLFDSPQVPDAIASSPIPVVVGVGHSTDTTAADLVCYASLPTPSAAAEWLIARRQHAQRQLGGSHWGSRSISDHVDYCALR